MIRHALIALASSLLATSTLAAQAGIVDEGSFTISVNGSRVGREDFSIKSTPGAAGAATFVASATVTWGDRRVAPAMKTDESASPVGYEVTWTGAEGAQRFRGTITRGRMSTTLKTPRGESAKEFIVADHAFILDDDVFHQYYFLARKKVSGSVAVVVPRRNAQVTMRVAAAGSDRVTIGGEPIAAEKLVVTEPGGDERQVWVDSAARVLKVAIPSRGIVAQRDDPPR